MSPDPTNAVTSQANSTLAAAQAATNAVPTPVPVAAHASPVTSIYVLGVIGLLIGTAGGALRAAAIHTSVAQSLIYGAIFGVAFGALFARRATSAGAGLIWGLASHSSRGLSSPTVPFDSSSTNTQLPECLPTRAIAFRTSSHTFCVSVLLSDWPSAFGADSIRQHNNPNFILAEPSLPADSPELSAVRFSARGSLPEITSRCSQVTASSGK